MDRILKDTYFFKDPASKIHTRELYALIWLGIHDASIVSCKVQAPETESQRDRVLSLLVEGLYETQRGYNLSETGDDADMLAEDRPICTAGSFNKPLEKMESMLPDVQIIFMTLRTASDKLQVVVREEIRIYLENLQKTERKECIAKLKKEGTPEPIWEKIRLTVARRIFDEFGSLFCTLEDPQVLERFKSFLENGEHEENQINIVRLAEFVDGGKYVDLGNLSCLNSIESSPNLSGSRFTLRPSTPVNTEEVGNNNNAGPSSGV